MKIRFSHGQIIILGFFLMIVAGTLLLSLPVSTASGQHAPLLTALFTATSASCVTGLVLQDTATYWSPFGKVVIITLIQIGGLGFMTISTMFFLLLRSKMGLRQREVLVESINTTAVGGVLALTRLILIGTAVVELLGAALLSIRFIPLYGAWRGMLVSLFHSISAFCNAGFDLMGEVEPYTSFTPFAGDWLVNLTLIFLITAGGIGFAVWDDLRRNKLHTRHYCFQTRLVLLTSGILLLGGAVVIWLFERRYTMSALPADEQVLTALFASATARTAGFNTVDVGAMSEGGRLITMILMFIGGSPGATAGGVKTTTIVVVAVAAVSVVLGKQHPNVLGRRISDELLHKAVAVVMFNLVIALCGTLALCLLQDFPLSDTLFECVSAIGTVGMTTGITRELNTLSALIVAAIMFAGRVGSVSFAMALMEKKARPAITCPMERLTIG